AHEPPPANPTPRAGIAVITPTPRQTHQFAQSQSLTKPDAKDAKIPPFSAQMKAKKEDWQPIPSPPPTEGKEVWEALLNRRNQSA
ncbi:IS110 family transposase, partial [Neisseria meningitidis]